MIDSVVTRESGQIAGTEPYRYGYTGYSVYTNRLLMRDVVVAEAQGAPAVPGRTYSWAPYAMGAIAFVDKEHRLAIVDQGGHTRTVPNTKDVLLPAWSPDGTRIAYLQKAGNDRYTIVVVDVGQHDGEADGSNPRSPQAGRLN